MTNQPLKNLGEAELEIMQVIWRANSPVNSSFILKGQRVMLALGVEHALIYRDSEHCFIDMSIMGRSDEGLTVETLEHIADGIDFIFLEDVRTP